MALVAALACASAVRAQEGAGLPTSRPAAELPTGDVPSSRGGAATSAPFYIPGMPVPEPEEGEGAAPAAGQAAGGAGEGGGRIGSIRRVDRSGGGGAEAAPTGPPPAATEIYSGVIPGERDRLGGEGDARRGRRALTWVGFQPGARGSVVFMRTTGAPDYEVRSVDDGMGIEVVFNDTRAPQRNTLRSIDTRYWATAATSIDARRVGRRAIVAITLHKKVSYDVRAQEGFVFVTLDDAGTAPAEQLPGAPGR